MSQHNYNNYVPPKRFCYSRNHRKSKSIGGEVLAIPGILELVISYLPAKTLSSTVQQVSKHWYEVVKRELWKRIGFELVLGTALTLPSQTSTQYDALRCSGLAMQLLDSTNESRFIPYLCLTFVHNRTMESRPFISRFIDVAYIPSRQTRIKPKQTFKVMPKFFDYILPKTSQYVMLQTSGVVSCPQNSRETVNIDPSDLNGGGVSLFMTKFTNFYSSVFILPKMLSEEENLAAIGMLQYIKLPPGQNPGLVLLFSAQHGDVLENMAIKLNSLFPNTIILGGFVDDHNVYKQVSTLMEDECVSGIAFSSCSLSSSSVLLLDSDDNEQAIKNRFYTLRNSIVLRNNVIAFSVICCARNAKLELKLFKDVFPSIPLIGFYGYGEMGNHFINLPSRIPKVYLYSSIYTIVTFS